MVPSSPGNFEANMCSKRMWKLTMYFSLLFQLPLPFCPLFSFICYPANDPVREPNAPQLRGEWLLDFLSQIPEVPWDSCVGP